MRQLARPLRRQHYIGKCNSVVGAEPHFKYRRRRFEQLLAARKDRVEALGLSIEQYTCLLGVVEPPSNIAEGIADGEPSLRAGRIVAKLGAMDFEPQTSMALAEGQKLGFG